MDRRHRTILSLGGTGLAVLLALGGSLRAQNPGEPSVASTPVPTATPWVQASAPPAAKPANVTLRIDREGRYFINQEKEALSGEQLSGRLHALYEAQGSNVRVVLRPEPQTPMAAVVAVEERLRDAGIDGSVVSDAPTKGPAAHEGTPPVANPNAKGLKREEAVANVKLPPRVLQKAEQLPPDERETFERNRKMWFALPKEERVTIRDEAQERVTEETEAAYANSGLNLSPDQREVFDLRYRQERRRLEREIQEKARAERAHRLPEIVERIKRELAATNAADNRPKASPPPAATLTPVN